MYVGSIFPRNAVQIQTIKIKQRKTVLFQGLVTALEYIFFFSLRLHRGLLQATVFDLDSAIVCDACCSDRYEQISSKHLVIFLVMYHIKPGINIISKTWKIY